MEKRKIIIEQIRELHKSEKSEKEFDPSGKISR